MSTLQKYEVNEQDAARKLQLWTDSYMKEASAEEVGHFHNICLRTGLSPEMKQIYPVPRYSTELKRYVWSFQVSIDGFRLIAERTGRYAPGRQSDYTYNDKNELISATAYVKKRTDDGTWHEVAHTAFYKEYVQFTKEGKPTKFWQNMEHVMLSKCAESCALRKAFPADLSGLYTTEEMMQAESEKPKNETITQEQADEIEKLLEPLSIEYIENLLEWAQVKSFSNLSVKKYEALLKSIHNQRSLLEKK